MMPHVDVAPYGARVPGRLDRAVLAATRGVPANWLGLRLAILLRKIVMRKLADGAIDTQLWGVRLRLYPRRNGCERNALFTPQMFDILERAEIAAMAERAIAAHGTVTFVDIGANVGLYSLFVAARFGSRARIIAIEPQPGILDRLEFNLRANPGLNVTVVPVALADRDGEVELVINDEDSGGSYLVRDPAVDRIATSRVPCRTLAGVLSETGVAAIDVLKIDVEGFEDLVLGPFLRDAPESLLPRLVLIEDTSGIWNDDVFAMLEQRGYVVTARSKHNVVLQLD